MKININLNKDDANINDYLYCASVFEELPNKIKLYQSYNFDKFYEFITPLKKDDVISKDIINALNDLIVNEKHLSKIEDGIYISYHEYDKESDMKYIADVVLYYSSLISKGVIDEILESLSNCKIDYQTSEKNKYNTIFLNQEGLYLEPIDVIDADYENIELFYNKDVYKSSQKLIKKLKSKKKGLTIIYGERGTGKTTLATHICSHIDRLCIFVPSNMIDLSITNNDFRNLIKSHSESVLIIDDSEIFFSSDYTKSNIFTNNLIQMVDGFSSDADNLHIIIILNVDGLQYIDPTLLECNNLIDILFVDKLDSGTIDALCKHLEKKSRYKDQTKLVDVLSNRADLNLDSKIGF